MITGFLFSLLVYIIPLIIMWIAAYMWLKDTDPYNDLGIVMGVLLIMVALIPVVNAILAVAITLKFLITKILQEGQNKRKKQIKKF